MQLAAQAALAQYTAELDFKHCLMRNSLATGDDSSAVCDVRKEHTEPVFNGLYVVRDVEKLVGLKTRLKKISLSYDNLAKIISLNSKD